MPILIFAVLAPVVLLSACASPKQTHGHSQPKTAPGAANPASATVLSRAEVIALAKRVAASHKIPLDEYQGPIVWEPAGGDHKWRVMFYREKFLGDHFIVRVDDSTGETSFWPGE